MKNLREKDGQVREIICPGDPRDLLNDLHFQIDSQNRPNIILKEDMAVELGRPDRSSFQTVLVVRQSDELRDGRITLIGPDILESADRSLPFGQVLAVAGEGLQDLPLRDLERKQYVSDRIPGYMIRSGARRIWARVSREALEKGFSFEILGRNMMAHYRQSFPLIETMEILFVTSSDRHVDALRALFDDKVKVLQNRVKKIYGCTNDIDCEDCPNKPVCDRISQMAEQFLNKKEINRREMKDFAQEILGAGRP